MTSFVVTRSQLPKISTLKHHPNTLETVPKRSRDLTTPAKVPYSRCFCSLRPQVYNGEGTTYLGAAHQKSNVQLGWGDHLRPAPFGVMRVCFCSCMTKPRNPLNFDVLKAG